MTREQLERKAWLSFEEEEIYLGFDQRYPDPKRRRTALNRFNYNYSITRNKTAGGRVKRSDIDKVIYS